MFSSEVVFSDVRAVMCVSPRAEKPFKVKDFLLISKTAGPGLGPTFGRV